MKRVIGGKVYNTETAKEIAQWDNGLSYSDFDQCSEGLYKTTKGAFFIAGSGGARSKWSESVGNWQSAGEGIIVLTTSGAMDWCECHDVDADIIAKHFTVQEG